MGGANKVFSWRRTVVTTKGREERRKILADWRGGQEKDS